MIFFSETRQAFVALLSALPEMTHINLHVEQRDEHLFHHGGVIRVVPQEVQQAHMIHREQGIEGINVRIAMKQIHHVCLSENCNASQQLVVGDGSQVVGTTLARAFVHRRQKLSRWNWLLLPRGNCVATRSEYPRSRGRLVARMKRWKAFLAQRAFEQDQVAQDLVYFVHPAQEMLVQRQAAFPRMQWN